MSLLTLHRLADDYHAYLKHERGISQTTYITYVSWVRAFLRWMGEGGHRTSDLSAFTTPVLRQYLYHLSSRKLRPRTVQSAFYPLRGVGQFLVDSGLLTENPAKAVTLPKKDAARRALVSSEEIAALLQAAPRLHPPRRAALACGVLSVLVYTRLRFQEMIDLKAKDLGLHDGTLLVANGKGGKSRLLYPPAECFAALEGWLTQREAIAPEHDWLWAENKKRRVGEATIRDVLEEVKSVAGLRGHENIKPPSLRHAFASRLMENGASIKAVQVSLGHAHLATTALYCHINEEAAKSIRQYASLNPTRPDPAPTPAEPKPRAADFHRRRRATPK